MPMKYCQCRKMRRSDCRAGADCRALLQGLTHSHRAEWVGARLVIGAGIAFGLAAVGRWFWP